MPWKFRSVWWIRSGGPVAQSRSGVESKWSWFSEGEDHQDTRHFPSRRKRALSYFFLLFGTLWLLRAPGIILVKDSSLLFQQTLYMLPTNAICRSLIKKRRKPVSRDEFYNRNDIRNKINNISKLSSQLLIISMYIVFKNIR